MKVVLAILGSIMMASSSESACPLGHGSQNDATFNNLAGEEQLYPQSATASQKMSVVRSKIAETAGTPGTYPSALQFAKLFLESMAPSEDTVADEFIPGRLKLIHSVGAVAEAKIVWKKHSQEYTGLFEADASYGFVRLSSATEPDYTRDEADKGNFTPGIGFKFFRDGAPSANVMALNNLGPSTSWNFFKEPLSNHVPVHDGMALPQTLLAKKFSTVSDWAGFLGCSDFARYTENGKSISDENIGFPFQLIFHPDEELQDLFPDHGFGRDLFPTQLRDLEEGQHLYSIYAKDTHSTPEKHIGDLYMTTAFVESSYADSTMFLQHQRFEDDMKLRPEPDFLDGCGDLKSCPVCPNDIAC